jgi:hypothetical protein
VYFIGDVHGKIKQYRRIIRGLPEGSKSLQLGDMGIGFKGVRLYNAGSMLRGEHLFIRGNHDDPAACRKHPLYIGEYGFDEQEKLFWLGGAWSIDREWRTEGVSWWRDEELNSSQLENAYDLYVSAKPRIVATHEAPSKAALTMLSELIPNPYHEFSPTDQSVRLKTDDYRYYKEKLGCVTTRTSGWLQEMLEAWPPSVWLFGHYHLTKSFKLGETEFQCLGELAVREIK